MLLKDLQSFRILDIAKSLVYPIFRADEKKKNQMK